MITFGRKSSPSAPEGGERKQRPSTNTESSVGNSSVSRRTGATRGQYVSTSAMGGSGAASGATQIGTVPLDIDINPIMDGMTYQTDERQLFEVYRDIYFHDPICGATVICSVTCRSVTTRLVVVKKRCLSRTMRSMSV